MKRERDNDNINEKSHKKEILKLNSQVDCTQKICVPQVWAHHIPMRSQPWIFTGATDKETFLLSSIIARTFKW